MSKQEIPPLKCKNCDKEYTRQSGYDKHKLLCINNNKTNIENIEELENCSLKEIVIELIKSNNRLRKDVDELKQWAQIKKKKKNVLDWLNTNYKPKQNYKEFVSELLIRREQLEIVFNLNLIDGIQEILQNYIEEMKKSDKELIIPLQSFEVKDNAIYIYNSNNTWELLSTSDYNELFSKISKGLLTELNVWKEENIDKLYNEDFSTICIQNTKKIIGGDMPLDKQRVKSHKNLHNYIKRPNSMLEFSI